ncbi:MAG: hypothetical protein IJU66_01635 [Oscillospiraceae bacterium]|nr:hypothetical protein [Oscillospiraceae bacterium]
MKFDHLFRLKSSAPAFREYEADGVTMRLDFFRGILRVALLRENVPRTPTWSVCPEGGDCPLAGRGKLSTEGFETVSPDIDESEKEICFTLSGVHFRVELRNFRITAENEKGVLYQDRSGLAYNFDGELGDGSVHFTRREEGERVFGLGDKCGTVNKSLRSFALGAGDAMGFRAECGDPLYKQVPFYICENAAGSYGLYYDTYSNGRVNLGQEHDNYFEPFNSIRFEEENMVFYLLLGTTAEIVRGFSRLCGGMAPVPEWAHRYCGSTMSYTDAPDADAQLRGFAAKCEGMGIRAGGFYLSSGYTQIGDKRCVFHWNTDKIPSPEGLASFFRARGMALIPNVKPAFLTGHPLFEELARQGLFLHYRDGSPALFPFWGGMAAYLDFTNPAAYAFWKRSVRETLVERGYRSIWNDNNEYDVWDAGVYACGFGHELPARRIRPLFSYLMSRASREACLESGEAEPFLVSRCAIAGTPRVATTWTGDNLTSFRDLRYNHYQAMTLSLSGFYWFGQDIGGFSGPKPEPELFLRWLQYGVFTPRFVLHSWKIGEEPTMPWLYPELTDTVRALFDLRERMVPYLYAETQRSVRTHDPLIYPVFLHQSDYSCESDCFFCGDGVLACPVFDRGAAEVRVTLPRSTAGWLLRGTGEPYPGGCELAVPCAPDDLPVWFAEAGRKTF